MYMCIRISADPNGVRKAYETVAGPPPCSLPPGPKKYAGRGVRPTPRHPRMGPSLAPPLTPPRPLQDKPQRRDEGKISLRSPQDTNLSRNVD